MAMRRNVAVLFVVCVGFGFSKGLFDFAAPLFLRSEGHSFRDIGAIFSLSALAIFFLRIYLARLSDLLGRKLFYAGALGLTGLSNLLFPHVRGLLSLAGLKTGSDLSFGVRETMHATALYESQAHGYLNLHGKTRCVEMACIGLGALAAGYLITATGYPVVFAVPAVVLFVTTVAFARWFREPRVLAEKAKPKAGLVALLTTHFPREIKILALGGFIFGVGLSASHFYLPPLFFSQKFGLAAHQVAQIQLVHTLSHVPGLFLVGWLVRRRLKRWFFWTLLVEGLLMIGVGAFETLAPTVIFWWSHDLIGASLWVPVQWTLIQRYARPDSRGLDASVVPAFTALGGILGPFLAGVLADLRHVPFTGAALSPNAAISLPMLASGCMMALAAMPLLWLPSDPEDDQADEKDA
jgi:MFS family permease